MLTATADAFGAKGLSAAASLRISAGKLKAQTELSAEPPQHLRIASSLLNVMASVKLRFAISLHVTSVSSRLRWS